MTCNLPTLEALQAIIICFLNNRTIRNIAPTREKLSALAPTKLTTLIDRNKKVRANKNVQTFKLLTAH